MNRPLIRFATTALIAALGITTAFAGSNGGGTRIFVGESRPVVDKAIIKTSPQPKQKTKPQGSTSAVKPAQGGNPKPGTKPGPDPKPGPKPRPNNEISSVVYYTDGFEVNIDQVQQAVQELQPLLEQVMQNMPSAEQIQEMARQLEGPVSQQVEQVMQNMPSAEQIQEMARQLEGPVSQQVEQVMQNMPSAEQIQETARQLEGPVSQQVEQAVQQLPQPIQEALNEPIIITPQSVNNGKNSKSKRSSKWTYDVPGMTGGDGNGPLIYNP